MTIVRAITTATITATFILGLSALPALADQSGTFTVYGTDDCQQLGANLVTTGNVYVLAGKKTADAPADGAALVSFPGAGQCWTSKPAVPKGRHAAHAGMDHREYISIGACAICSKMK